jgi:hypothetical protein
MFDIKKRQSNINFFIVPVTYPVPVSACKFNANKSPVPY